ncbi:MAG: MCE family protein [Planctomycetaceae bacterium]|nr:MCE family protein [Planctomycetales bacterium]MCB9938911.1 MCE family protein [Planctomycetaceae bacterium]
MNEKLIAFRVGVVVVAAACLAVVLIGIFGGGKGVFKSRYTIYLRFPRAPGVTVDTPVRKNGVHIGRVTDVSLKKDHVVLTAMIDSDREIMKSEVCTISTTSLLGDPVLEFVQGSDRPQSEDVVHNGDFLADGVVATDPLQVLTNLEGDIRKALGAISGAASDVSAVASNLNQTFGSDTQQLQRILNKSELALDTFSRTMTTIDDVIGDPELKQGLKQSLSDLPKIFNDVQLTMSQARDAMANFERVGKKAEQNLDNLAEFTGPLGQKGEQLMNDLGRSVQNLEEISSQLVVFTQAINSSDGTLGKFINDRELYDDLRETIGNFHAASRRLEPILRDVRIITDKVSVDPGGTLLKRALENKPPGVGRKWPDTGIPFTEQR